MLIEVKDFKDRSVYVNPAQITFVNPHASRDDYCYIHFGDERTVQCHMSASEASELINSSER